jgi:hypothetical protein
VKLQELAAIETESIGWLPLGNGGIIGDRPRFLFNVTLNIRRTHIAPYRWPLEKSCGDKIQSSGSILLSKKAREDT